MPLYMDVHRNLGAVKADDVAMAHLKDMEVQDTYGVRYHRYWFNEETGAVFCLVEGPDAATCEKVHREAHGLVADDLIEVEPRLVEAFLAASGAHANGAALSGEGSIDNGFRVVLFTEVDNFADVFGHSEEAGLRLMTTHDRIVREGLRSHHGHEIKHTEEGIMACFVSVASALRFSEEVLHRCAVECEETGGKPLLKIGISAGEPVEQNRDLFGVAVTAARRICEMAPAGSVMVSGAVRELAVGKGFRFTDEDTIQVKGLPDPVQLFSLQTHSHTAPEISQQPEPIRPRARRTVMLHEFWQELKRRHVVPVIAVYSAVVFLLLQVAQLTFQPLGLPPWAYTFVLVIGIFGLPIAAVLAWAFDLNLTTEREGSRRRERM